MPACPKFGVALFPEKQRRRQLYPGTQGFVQPGHPSRSYREKCGPGTCWPIFDQLLIRHRLNLAWSACPTSGVAVFAGQKRQRQPYPGTQRSCWTKPPEAALAADKTASGGCCPANTSFFTSQNWPSQNSLYFLRDKSCCWLGLPEAHVSWPLSHAQPRQGLTENMVL